MTDEQEAMTEVQPGTMTVSEVMSLVNLFNTMLQAMESRLVAKMDDNTKSAAERWRLHDEELERNRITIVTRFENIEKSLLLVERSLDDHLGREHDEDIANEARVKPVKTVAGWLWGHWRDLVLLFIGLVAAATFVVDWLSHTFGQPT